MKTVKEIDKEINDITKSLKKDSVKAEVDKAKRDIVFLRQIKFYLETEPREDFVKEQLKSVQIRIENIMSHYEAWTVGKTLTKFSDPKKVYLNEMGLPTLNSQEKTLKYILD
jgi:hypothetical protein